MAYAVVIVMQMGGQRVQVWQEHLLGAAGTLGLLEDRMLVVVLVRLLLLVRMMLVGHWFAVEQRFDGGRGKRLI